MLFLFEFSLYRFGGCRQPRVSACSQGRPADGRTVYIKPAGHFASGDRQVLRGNKADQGASKCNLNASSRPGQFLLFDAKITARSGDDQRINRYRPIASALCAHKAHRRFSGLFRRIHCSLKCARHLQAESQPIFILILLLNSFVVGL